MNTSAKRGSQPSRTENKSNKANQGKKRTRTQAESEDSNIDNLDWKLDPKTILKDRITGVIRCLYSLSTKLNSRGLLLQVTEILKIKGDKTNRSLDFTVEGNSLPTIAKSSIILHLYSFSQGDALSNKPMVEALTKELNELLRLILQRKRGIRRRSKDDVTRGKKDTSISEDDTLIAFSAADVLKAYRLLSSYVVCQR